MATYNGDDNANTIYAEQYVEDNNDVINGYGGDDKLFGLDGSDIIHGGDGNDHIVGPDKPDAGPPVSLYGGDSLYGDAGDDVIVAGYDSYVDGGSGNDEVFLNFAYLDDDGTPNTVGVTAALNSASTHLAVAGYTIDLVSIEAIDITLTLGADNFTGGDLADHIIGGDGNDVLSGAGGDDLLYGGKGADVLDGGAGNDTVTYFDATTQVTVDLAAGTARGGGGGDTLISIENVIGGQAKDIITGNDADNVLSGRGGDDILKGGAGNDILDGGAGNDKLDGGDGVNTASYADAAAGVTVDLGKGAAQNTGGAGVDTLIDIQNLTGSDYADVLVGSSGANVLRGGDGDDLLKPGGGADTVDGGAGNDTVSYADAGASVTVNLALAGPQDTGGGGIDTLISIENVVGSAYGDLFIGSNGDNVFTGGAGNDTVNYSLATASVTVDLRISGPQDTHGGGTDSFVGIENITGSTFDDVLYGSTISDPLNGLTAGNVLIGGAGNDVLWGLGGNDSLKGGPGDDVLIGGEGNDILDGGDGTNTASYVDATVAVTVGLNIGGPQDTGGAGIDSLTSIQNLTGSDYADVLTGNAHDNVLDGGEGNDVITARDGVDVLNGGGGDDVLDGGSGKDTLNGGAGYDIASYADATAGVTVALSQSGPQATHGGGQDTLIGIEGVIGSDYADTLTGNAGDNVMSGGAGADVIKGWAGDDQITGGAGVDTLTGGQGADTFVYLAVSDSAAGSADTITDFQHAVDRISLTAVDADSTTAGDQAFTWIDTGAFSHTAGELRYFVDGSGAHVQGDVNGDGMADFAISLTGVTTLSQGDFLL